MSGWIIALLVAYCMRFLVGTHYIARGGYVERTAVGTVLITMAVVDFIILLLAGVIV